MFHARYCLGCVVVVVIAAVVVVVVDVPMDLVTARCVHTIWYHQISIKSRPPEWKGWKMADDERPFEELTVTAFKRPQDCPTSIRLPARHLYWTFTWRLDHRIHRPSTRASHQLSIRLLIWYAYEPNVQSMARSQCQQKANCLNVHLVTDRLTSWTSTLMYDRCRRCL